MQTTLGEEMNIDHITRRLLGRHLVTIDNVTGIPGQAPAIVVTFHDDGAVSEYSYDDGRDIEDAKHDARHSPWLNPAVYDIIDNTL